MRTVAVGRGTPWLARGGAPLVGGVVGGESRVAGSPLNGRWSVWSRFWREEMPGFCLGLLGRCWCPCQDGETVGIRSERAAQALRLLLLSPCFGVQECSQEMSE